MNSYSCTRNGNFPKLVYLQNLGLYKLWLCVLYGVDCLIFIVSLVESFSLHYFMNFVMMPIIVCSEIKIMLL